MQKDHPMFDEFARMMGTAAGLAQAAGEEAKAVMRSQAEILALELDLVRREELEAALERLEALEARVEALDGGAETSAPKTAEPDKKTS